MNLITWNPWRETEPFSKHLNRFFERSILPAPSLESEKTFSNWKPAADIYDHDDKIVIKAELPGVNKEDIHVDLKNNILTLEGERSIEKEVEDESFYRRERFHGKFSRSFVLPRGLDPEKINADYKDGVLNIEISKPEEKKVKKISVH